MKKIPEIKFHKTRKDYYLYLGRKYHYLGKTLEEAERKRRRLIADAFTDTPAEEPTADYTQSMGLVTVADLLAKFLDSHTESRSWINYRRACIYVLQVLGGNLLVSRFGPNALRKVRDKIIASGVSRQYVNKLTGMIRTIFSWGVGYELVPTSVAGALKYVRAIEKTHSQSPESKPVKPISDATIDATLPELSRTVAAMVRIQRLTGMRPSEVCEMRESEIDYSGVTWIYRKADHKNTWRRQDRIVPLGPQARAILSSFIDATSDGNDYLFSPIRAQEERYAELRAARKSKVQPSQVSQKKAKPTLKAALGDFYSEESYYRAIARAGVEHWFPYQIRHTAATKIRERHGIEGSQVLLGHSTIDATQIYAERNLAEAIKIAENEG